MPQQVLTPEWVVQLIDVIRDNRPIIYSDGGLTVYSSDGFHKAPPHKYGMALIQGFQDPIGLQANSIEYAYVRYIDSQLVISTNLPDPAQALLIATIYTDTYKVTQIINHMVQIPDTSGLPFLPEPTPPPTTPPPYTLPQYIKTSVLINLEKPRVKYYPVDISAPFPYLLKSISSKAGLGGLNFSILKNGTPLGEATNLNVTTTTSINPFNTAVSISQGDQWGVQVNSINNAADVGITIYAYGMTNVVISNTL